MNQGGSYDRYLPVQDGIAARFRKKESPGLFFFFSPTRSLTFLTLLGIPEKGNIIERKFTFRKDTIVNHHERIQILQGVPTNFTMMPQLLKQAGYSTHGFGEWMVLD